MPIAEIITIGTELLLGEIQDTNTQFIARTLRDYGIDIYRTTIIGDNPERVAQAVHDACLRAQIIITTGGLGPTVDDPTREAIALAINTDLEYHTELWDQIIERFNRFGRSATENNKRQAYIPKGATVVENPVGTAPAFIAEYQGKSIISLPGVPQEMEYLMINAILPYLQQKFPLHGIIKARVLHTVGMGESQVDEYIGDLERSKNPTVGLLAHPGQVDVRIAVKAETEEQANSLIKDMESIVRERLGNIIFGVDNESLEEIIKQKLNAQNITITLLECGMSGSIAQRLSKVDAPVIQSVLFPETGDSFDLKHEIRTINQRSHSANGLGVSLKFFPNENRQILEIVLILNTIVRGSKFSYGGPPANAIYWATTTAMDFFRKCLMEITENHT